jgi:hypothetical protein
VSKDRDKRKRAEKAARATEQQRKNREANIKARATEVMKPKIGMTPSKAIMDAVADSMYEAVTSVFSEIEKAGLDTGTQTPAAKMKGLCMYYAAAGQYVADAIVGREYFVQVGSLGIEVGNGMMMKIDAADGGVAARRFHMWLAADTGAGLEYVDFTSRYFKEWSVASGSTWERGDVPNYLWGKQKDIREQHGVHYQIEISAEPDADKAVTANDAIIEEIRKRATALAKKRLGI